MFITMHHLTVNNLCHLVLGYLRLNSIVFSVLTCLQFIISGLLKELQMAELQLRELIIKMVLDKVGSGGSCIVLSINGGFAFAYRINHQKTQCALDTGKLYEFPINLLILLFTRHKFYGFWTCRRIKQSSI